MNQNTSGLRWLVPFLALCSVGVLVVPSARLSDFGRHEEERVGRSSIDLPIASNAKTPPIPLVESRTIDTWAHSSLTQGLSEDAAIPTRPPRIPALPDPSSSTTKAPRFAYVFVYWGINPSDPSKKYRSYLANIMISAKLLRRWGSTADIVLMAKLRYTPDATSGNTSIAGGNQNRMLSQELPEEDRAMLTKLGIRVVYLPATPDETSVYRQMFLKIHVWTLVEYERILYLDSDVMPMANLDYLLEMSVEGILAPTVGLAGWAQPANGGFLVLEPNQTDFEQLQHLVDTRKGTKKRPFDAVEGWGHAIQPPDRWETNLRAKQGTRWDFYAAEFDQGLFYHYPKYVKKRLTNIFARKVVNYGTAVAGGGHNRSGETTFVVEHQWNVTSRKSSPFANRSKRQVAFSSDNCARMTGKSEKPWPGCVPPYSDLSHFTGKHSKPWAQGPPARIWKVSQLVKLSTNQTDGDKTGASDEGIAARTASELWWMTLQDLEREDGIDITVLGLNLSAQSSKRKE